MSSNAEEIVNKDEPVVVLPIVEPVIEEKVYEYQPTDSDNRPIGGKQVIKYRTEQELVDKLTNQSVHQIRKMRDQERKLRLGIVEQDSIDDNAVRAQKPVEFKRRVLTGDERVKLSQDILDPETVDQAFASVVEAHIGISPDDLAKTISDLQRDNMNIKAQRESDIFMARNPEYVKCPENGQAIAHWIDRYNLAPSSDNFQKAYNTLKEAGVLITSLEVIKPLENSAPIALVEPVKEDEHIREDIPVENQPDQPQDPPKQRSRVPLALNNDNSSSIEPSRSTIGDDIVYEYVQRDSAGRQVGEKRVFKGLKAIEAMPSEEYKRRLLSDPSFSKKVIKLQQESDKRHQRG